MYFLFTEPANFFLHIACGPCTYSYLFLRLVKYTFIVYMLYYVFTVKDTFIIIYLYLCLAHFQPNEVI